MNDQVPSSPRLSDERLLPCPHCGNSTRAEVVEFDGEPPVPGYMVRCNARGWENDPAKGCGSTTGWAETPDDAIAAWNRRPSSAVVTEEMVRLGAEALRKMYHGETAEDEPFHLMARAALTAALSSSPLPEPNDRVGEWQDIATAPKNKTVLAAYRNALGNWRIVTACYHTQLEWSDDHLRDDDDESEYAPEGWYEESDSSETIYPTDHPPSHWMPLPKPPALPSSAQRETER